MKWRRGPRSSNLRDLRAQGGRRVRMPQGRGMRLGLGGTLELRVGRDALGGVVGDHTSECHAAERKDGSIYLNARTIKGTELRTIATSKDGGATWSKPKFEEALYDPHCQACVHVLPKSKPDDQTIWLVREVRGFRSEVGRSTP